MVSRRYEPVDVFEVCLGWEISCDKIHRDTFSEILFSRVPAAEE